MDVRCTDNISWKSFCVNVYLEIPTWHELFPSSHQNNIKKTSDETQLLLLYDTTPVYVLQWERGEARVQERNATEDAVREERDGGCCERGKTRRMLWERREMGDAVREERYGRFCKRGKRWRMLWEGKETEDAVTEERDGRCCNRCGNLGGNRKIKEAVPRGGTQVKEEGNEWI